MPDRFNAHVILPVAVAGLALVTHFGHYTDTNAFDFYQFWIFGQAARHSGSVNIYAEVERTRIGEMFYKQSRQDGLSQRHHDVAATRRQPQAVSSPLLYTLFGLCSEGHFELDYFNYQLLAAACVAAGVLLLGSALGYSLPLSCLWLGVLLAWFGPFFSDVEVGNVNRFQLLLIGLYCWLATRESIWTRDVLGGVVLSAMITFKPNLALAPVLLVATWLVTGDVGRLLRQLAGMIVGGVAAVGLSAVYFGGASSWLHWLAALRDTTQNIQTHDAGNVSFARWLSGRTGVNLWLPLTAAASLLVLVAVGVGRRGFKGREAGTRDVLIVAAAAGIALLGSPLTWHHYLVLAAPLWMIMLMPDARFVGLMRSVGVLVLIAFGFARLTRDFAGFDRAFEVLVPIWWLAIALPLLVILAALARPREAAD